VLSGNEELQSINEELETAKEELQSTNEELTTLNDELQNRNLTLDQLNSDMINLFTSANLAVIMLGKDLCLRRFTPMAEKRLNLTAADIGRSILHIGLNIHVPDLERLISEAIHTGTVQEKEVLDREGVWYSIQVRPYRTVENIIDGAVLTWIDVDALKRSLEKIKESRDYAEAIVATVRESLVVLDKNLRIMKANRSFYQTFQASPNEVDGHLIYEVGNGQWDIPGFKKLLEDVLPQNTSFQDFEMEHEFPAIGRKVMRLNARSIPQGDDGPQMILLAIEDITQRRRMEEEVRKSRDALELRVQERTAELAGLNEKLQSEIAEREKAEEMLGQAEKMQALSTLVGGIAHDFNNILAVIGINGDLALSDLPPGSRTRKNLELIVKAGQHGRELVRQMLVFSRKSGKNPVVFSLSPLIKETYQLLRSSIPTTIGMELLSETESDLVSADPSQIRQVLMNLCTNAAYAMRGTMGNLGISLQNITFGANDPLPDSEMTPGDYLVLSVKDTGPGMDPEVKNRIFEPFFTTKPTGEGTGLGLSVVYGIVKSHKGGITVATEPGKGSVFQVFLPQADRGISMQAESPQPIVGGNERILFVDDEELIVISVQSMLQGLGYKVTAVTNSRDALRLFSENPSQFDLVITDYVMPLMTGEALAEEMMRIRSDVPVVLCTGYNELISSEKVTAMGFRALIMKPFTVREGAELVRRVLEKNRPK
jgi:two-component system CheB/CheR fusion protein